MAGTTHNQWLKQAQVIHLSLTSIPSVALAIIQCSYCQNFDTDMFGDMVKHELRVTNYELRVASHELRVQSLKARV